MGPRGSPKRGLAVPLWLVLLVILALIGLLLWLFLR